jgi:hypothetical protein
MVNAVIVMLNSDHWKSLNWVGDNTLRCTSGISLRDFCKSVSENNSWGPKNFHVPRVICVGQSL